MAHLRFEEGDLVEVSPRFVEGQWPFRPQDTAYPMGPRIVGASPCMKAPDLFLNNTFLVIKGSQRSGWHTNRKLYIEVLTPSGPRTAWADNFRMKKGSLSDISPQAS